MALPNNVPDDRYSLDPESQPPHIPESVPTADAATLHPELIALQLEQIADELSAPHADMMTAIRDMTDTVHAQLTAADMDTHEVIHDLHGTVDTILQDGASPAVGHIDKIANTVDSRLTAIGRELDMTGINYPFDPSLQNQLMGMPITDWLPTAIPGLASTVGIASVSTSPTSVQAPAQTAKQTVCPGQPDDWIPPPNTRDLVCPGTMDREGSTGYGTQPDPVTGQCPDGAIPGNQGQYVIPGDEANLRYGGWCPVNTNDDGGGTQQPPTTTGTPVPPPEVPPWPTSPPADKCCPPQQITVVSPPPDKPEPTAPEKKLPPYKVHGECRDWDVLNVCEVTSGIQTTTPGGGGETPGGAGDAEPEKNWLDQFSESAGGVIRFAFPTYAKIDAGVKLLTQNASLGLFGLTHDIAASMAGKYIDQLTGKCVADKPAAVALATMLAGVSWAETITGAPLKYLAQSNTYSLQFLAPQFLPGQADLDNLQLRDKIDEDVWTCLTKANGNLPQWHRAARDAKQALLTPDQITQLRRRNLITVKQYWDMMREAGYINDRYTGATWELSELPLGASDIVRCMVRDSFDAHAVAKYQYDKDFTEKFTGQARDWFYWQGYSEEQARYIWRAHWEIPSNTALYEMYHRLRPDRKEAVEYGEQLAAAEAAGGAAPAGDAPPVVTRSDIKEAMEINDMAPAWIDAMLAISMHPITNSDAARAYMIGYFDSAELIERFRDNGYTEDDATTLAEYWEFESNKRIRSQSGVLTPRKVLSLYKDGAIDRAAARLYLQDIFPNAQQLDKLLGQADDQQKAELVQTRSKLIKRSVITGEYTNKDAVTALIGLGINRNTAQGTADTWELEGSHRSKEVLAAQLCKWRYMGLITSDQHQQRLMRLGYPLDDARTISRVCEIDSAAKRAKEAKKAAKEALQDMKSNILVAIAEARQQLADLNAQIAAREMVIGGNE